MADAQDGYKWSTMKRLPESTAQWDPEKLLIQIGSMFGGIN